MAERDPGEQQPQRPKADGADAGEEALATNLRELNREPLTRSATLADWRKVEDDGDLVEFSFSSEQPVERFFGVEVLSSEPGAMNMARLNSKSAPWLWNHDASVVLGAVEKAWQGPDGRGYVRTRWSPNTRLEGSEEWKVRQNWEAGIVRTVSFAYSIDAPLDFNSREGVALVTAYTPLEVSTVSVPADWTVGQGRSVATDQATAPAAATHTPTVPTMETQTPDLEAVRAQAAADAQKAERDRIASITSLTREHGVDIAQGLIERGATVEEAQAEVLKELAKRASQPKQHAAPAASASSQSQPIAGSADIGLTEKEARSFSFLRAIRAQAMPNNRQAQEDAAFEREVSAAVEQKLGIRAQGYLVANEVLTMPMARAMSAGTASAGGDLIAPDFRGDSYIDRLVNRLALSQAGITTLTGLSGPVSIPKGNAGPTAYWVGENEEPLESSPTVRQVDLTPKTLGAFTEISRQLMLQSSMDSEMFVRNELLRSQALEIDRCGLYGTGTNAQPQGVRNVTGINTEDFANDNPSYGELVSMESKVNADNADVGEMAYITNSTRYGGFKTTEKATNTAQFVLEPGGTVNGYPVIRSNQVLTGDVFFGVWSQLLMGMWGGIDLQVNPYSLDKSGAVRVTVFQSVDFAVRYADSFCRGNNTL